MRERRPGVSAEKSNHAPELGHGRQDHVRQRDFGTCWGFPKSRHTVLPKLVTVCLYIAQYTTDLFLSQSQMNKALEVIEAHYLYGTSYDNIDVVIHPQSIIHSMVETSDSSVLAQLGWPDMRLPILYTMSWPERVECSEITWPRLDFLRMGDLTFREPDVVKYPSLTMGYAAGRAGGTMTGVFSAANEQAVAMFLDKKIGYFDIYKTIELAMEAHKNDLILDPTLDDIVAADLWARAHVKDLVESGMCKELIAV